jgi:hypothetical protein
MTISVHFPDGSVRDMPGELRMLDTDDCCFRQVPLRCHARWRFIEVDGRWLAEPRHGRVTRLAPPSDPWWRGIAAMEEPAATDLSSPRAA